MPKKFLLGVFHGFLLRNSISLIKSCAMALYIFHVFRYHESERNDMDCMDNPEQME